MFRLKRKGKGGGDIGEGEGQEMETRRLKLRKHSGENGAYASDSDVDTERDAQRHQSRANPPLGAGVLSSLLALYDRPERSGLSTPSSDYASDADPFEEAAMNADKNAAAEKRHHRRRIRRLLDPSSRDRDPQAKIKPEVNIQSSGAEAEGEASQNGSGSQPSSGLSSTPLRSSRGLDQLTDAFGAAGVRRPAQARNAGGVFGTLIASTGNLSGAAAPGPSRIAPNPTKHGYHLAR